MYVDALHYRPFYCESKILNCPLIYRNRRRPHISHRIFVDRGRSVNEFHIGVSPDGSRDSRIDRGRYRETNRCLLLLQVQIVQAMLPSPTPSGAVTSA